MESGRQSELDELRLNVRGLLVHVLSFMFQDSGKKPRLILDEAFCYHPYNFVQKKTA